MRQLHLPELLRGESATLRDAAVRASLDAAAPPTPTPNAHMHARTVALVIATLALSAAPLRAQGVPSAIYTDPAHAGLATVPLLVITSDDGLAPANDSLVSAVRARGNNRVTTVHFATDHSYSDKRIALESAVIRWLQSVAR